MSLLFLPVSSASAAQRAQLSALTKDIADDPLPDPTVITPSTGKPQGPTDAFQSQPTKVGFKEQRVTPQANKPSEADLTPIKLSPKDFTIEINEIVTQKTADDTIHQLMTLEQWYYNPDGSLNSKRVQHRPIRLVLNSMGGEAHAKEAILSHMESLKSKKIIVETYGKIAGSAAGILLAAGSKGHRFVYPSGFVIIHKTQMSPLPLSYQVPIATWKRIQLPRAEKLAHQSEEQLLRYTDGKVTSDLVDAHEPEWLFTAQEAIEYGLADAVGVPSYAPLPAPPTQPETA